MQSRKISNSNAFEGSEPYFVAVGMIKFLVVSERA